MRADLAEVLVSVMNECDFDAELYERYSGRGMFGGATAGVVVSSITDALTTVIACADRFVDSDGIPLFESADDLKWDSLATKTIIY